MFYLVTKHSLQSSSYPGYLPWTSFRGGGGGGAKSIANFFYENFILFWGELLKGEHPCTLWRKASIKGLFESSLTHHIRRRLGKIWSWRLQLKSVIFAHCTVITDKSFFYFLFITGGHARPGENFLKNLKNPGRMTGNIPSGGPGVPMLPVNTFFICTQGNP